MRSLRNLSFIAALALVPSLASADDSTATPRRDTNMFAAGIASVVTGGVAIVAGSTMLLVGSGALPVGCGSANNVFACPPANPTLEWAGGILLAIGAAATLAGIPMLVIGGKHRPLAVATITPFGVFGRF